MPINPPLNVGFQTQSTLMDLSPVSGHLCLLSVHLLVGRDRIELRLNQCQYFICRTNIWWYFIRCRHLQMGNFPDCNWRTSLTDRSRHIFDPRALHQRQTRVLQVENSSASLLSFYPHSRLESGQDDVAERTPGYGAVADTNRSIPVAQTRTRKYSESVGRSYVASAVARLSSSSINHY